MIDSMPEPPAAPARGNPRDWLEDYFASDNGYFVCLCHRCRNEFVGHKRRVVCRVCAPPAEEPAT